MAIVLRHGEINPIKSDARYVKKGLKEYVQYQGHAYRVVNYARHLTPCECFLRGLVWVLSYITIIPAIFFRARINRFLSEARTKTEEITVYTSFDFQAKFENLRRLIEDIKDSPPFIHVLVEQRFSLENYSAIKKWLKARDTLVVWQEIARHAQITEHNFNIRQFSSIEAAEEKAAKFNDWCVENADRIENIKNLNLYCLQLRNLPQEIGKLSQLETLDIQLSRLTNLPSELANLSQLKILSLSHNELRNFPIEISKLSQLETLNLGNNQLSDLPKEIGKLSQLKTLNLCHNRLRNLPKEIGKLTHLQELQLRENQLRSLPKEIGKLSQLSKFYLYENRLTSLPKEIGNLVQLKLLSLSYNQLKTLPKKIGKLSRLEELYLNNNQLRNLPQEVGKLPRLRCLWLRP